jgi:hypothetical protein
MPAPQNHSLHVYFDMISRRGQLLRLMNTPCLSLRNDNCAEIGLSIEKGSPLP